MKSALVPLLALFCVAAALPEHRAAAQTDVVYVALYDENNLGIVDPAAGRLDRRIQVGRNPDMIALNADRTKLYVSNTGEVTVSIVSLAEERVSQVLRLPANRRNIYAGPLVPAPDGSNIYVAERGDNPNDALRVYVIDTKKENIVAQFEAGRAINALAVSHDGAKVFVLNTGEAIGVFDAATNEKTGTVAPLKGFEKDLTSMACSPVDPVALVSYGTRNTVQIVNTATLKTEGTIEMPKYKTGDQRDICFSPDGKFAFVVNLKSNLKEVDGIDVIDVAKREVVKLFNSGVCERGMTVTPDGKTFYVAADMLKWYNLQTLEHIRSISLRTKIRGIAVVRR